LKTNLWDNCQASYPVSWLFKFKNADFDTFKLSVILNLMLGVLDFIWGFNYIYPSSKYLEFILSMPLGIKNY